VTVRSSRTSFVLPAAAAVATLLTACGATDTAPADALSVSAAWAKAADDGMTAAFADLQNTGDSDLHIVSVDSAVARSTELHEMVSDGAGGMVMQESDEGFVVPAGGTHRLAPGGDHIMFIGLLAPLTPGTDVPITVTFADGSAVEFSAQVRDYAGAQEDYAPGHGEPAGHDE